MAWHIETRVEQGELALPVVRTTVSTPNVKTHTEVLVYERIGWRGEGPTAVGSLVINVDHYGREFPVEVRVNDRTYLPIEEDE